MTFIGFTEFIDENLQLQSKAISCVAIQHLTSHQVKDIERIFDVTPVHVTLVLSFLLNLMNSRGALFSLGKTTKISSAD